MTPTTPLLLGSLAALSAVAAPSASHAEVSRGMAASPIVIAHRGASAYRPEHTLAAYELAIDMGADFIEPDLVSTRDARLIARHDNVLDLTTDVAERPEFAARRTTKTVDGVEITGWFSEDFTLAEIKRLRAVERIPDVRPGNTRYDGRFEVPTLEEILALIKRKERETGRTIGIYPETKHPTHFDSLGLSMEEPLVNTLKAAGYEGEDAPVFIQSFEVSNLIDLSEMTDLPIVQLLWLKGQPFDQQVAGTGLTYDGMATAQGLARIATYADAVGPEKHHFIIPKDAEGRLLVERTTTFVRDAHAAGLLVHPYTFRAETPFLPANVPSSLDELRLFLDTGIDGFFTDNPDIGRKAVTPAPPPTSRTP